MSLSATTVAVAAAIALGSGVAVGYVSGAAASAESASAATPSAQSTDTASPKPQPKPKPSKSATEGGYTSQLPPDTTVQKGKNGVDVVFQIPTKNPVFFITIDDGWSQDPEVVEYIKETKLPVTSFLTDDASQGNYSYFEGISKFDAVQNHTMTHQALSKESTDRESEICGAQEKYEAGIGTRPWILRPPYGAGFMPRRSTADAIEKVAASCGIKHIALWNVTVDKNGKMEFASDEFQRGDIVLLHFEGDLKAHLQMLVKEYGKRGLKPASLSEYLPA